jgi:hypothetical protein
VSAAQHHGHCQGLANRQMHCPSGQEQRRYGRRYAHSVRPLPCVRSRGPGPSSIVFSPEGRGFAACLHAHQALRPVAWLGGLAPPALLPILCSRNRPPALGVLGVVFPPLRGVEVRSLHRSSVTRTNGQLAPRGRQRTARIMRAWAFSLTYCLAGRQQRAATGTPPLGQRWLAA